MRGRVQGEQGAAEDGRGLAALAAQHGAHAGQQFADLEGLEDVVIGAGVQSGDAVVQGVAGGDDEHRQGGGLAADAAQYLQAVAAGQAEVQQDEVVVLGAQGREGAVAILHPVGCPGGIVQGAVDGVADHGVIFDEEDAHGAGEIWGRSGGMYVRGQLRQAGWPAVAPWCAGQGLPVSGAAQ